MSIQKQRKKINKVAGWDQAIADAKARIRELRYSIKVFTERKKIGDPWPSEHAQKQQQ